MAGSLSEYVGEVAPSKVTAIRSDARSCVSCNGSRDAGCTFPVINEISRQVQLPILISTLCCIGKERILPQMIESPDRRDVGLGFCDGRTLTHFKRTTNHSKTALKAYCADAEASNTTWIAWPDSCMRPFSGEQHRIDRTSCLELA
jgi:hypothetical protein